MKDTTIFANLIDIHSRRIFPAEILIRKGIIKSIIETELPVENYVLPGFIDAHIHIESSMVTPVAFSRTAVRHGTVGLITDPHEIANVLGLEGIEYMITNAGNSPLKILFGAPSCVPATPYESSGAEIDAEMIYALLQKPEIGFLSEMMNFPGVIANDPLVMEKLKVATKLGVPIDGHAPGVMGERLEKYVSAGISTDHECSSIDEALKKIDLGMKILIREGSGAKNFSELLPLLKKYPDRVMFCSDDLHPDDLLKGHINLLVKRAITAGYDLFDTIRAAGYNAEAHYKAGVGMLRINDPADFIMIDSLEDWNVISTYIGGIRYYHDKIVLLEDAYDKPINNFRISTIEKAELEVHAESKFINVIEAIDGELLTRKLILPTVIRNGKAVSDSVHDVLKIVVINRYAQARPAVGFIRGFGLVRGAIASSISHDSHNIICVGNSDSEICDTVNWIIEKKGGIAIHDGTSIKGLSLEVAGIMSIKSVEDVASRYSELSDIAGKLGSELKAPFMTLAFMALLVIPEIKMSDKGLFDGTSFSFTPLFIDEFSSLGE